MVDIYRFREHDLVVQGEKEDLIKVARLLRDSEGTTGDLSYRIEYAFDVDGIRQANAGTKDASDLHYAENYLITKRSRPVGRPRTKPKDIPNIFHKYLPMYDRQEITISDLSRLCGLTRPTIYKYLRLLGKKTISEQEADLE